jgi:hypothetical protein
MTGTGVRLPFTGEPSVLSTILTVPGSSSALWTSLESAIVGLRAQVTTFDDEAFEDRSLILKPGQQVPDSEERRGSGWLAIFEEIKSLRVTCLPRR